MCYLYCLGASVIFPKRKEEKKTCYDYVYIVKFCTINRYENISSGLIYFEYHVVIILKGQISKPVMSARFGRLKFFGVRLVKNNIVNMSIHHKIVVPMASNQRHINDANNAYCNPKLCSREMIQKTVFTGFRAGPGPGNKSEAYSGSFRSGFFTFPNLLWTRQHEIIPTCSYHYKLGSTLTLARLLGRI